VKIRSKAIWATTAIIAGLAVLNGNSGFFDLFGIWFTASFLNKAFGDQKDDEPAKLSGEDEDNDNEAKIIAPVGKHLITTAGAKQIRNLLLMHHNMKETDKDYTASAMAKDTIAVVAMLNVFLKGK